MNTRFRIACIVSALVTLVATQASPVNGEILRRIEEPSALLDASTPAAVSSAAIAIRPVPLNAVKLSATPSAPSYLVGEPVAISISLHNQSAGALGLSNLVDGNIVISSFKRDSGPVSSVASATSYADGFAPTLGATLRSVGSGSTLSMAWTSDPNTSLGGEGLRATSYTGVAEGKSLFFSLVTPGTYTLTFHYQYPGPTAGFPGTVFTAKTNSVTVTFTVI